MFKVDSHLLAYASFIMHFTSLICLLLHSPYIAKRRISLLLIKDPSVSHVSSFTFHFLKSFPTCFSVPVYLSLLSSSPTTHLIFLSTIICTFISIVVMLPHRMILFAPPLWRLRLPSSVFLLSLNLRLKLSFLIIPRAQAFMCVIGNCFGNFLTRSSCHSLPGNP